jgi:hypothetical protein
MGEKLVSYHTSHLNILSTQQEDFCFTSEKIFTSSSSKSILISQTGERERNKFFNILLKKIDESRNELN